MLDELVESGVKYNPDDVVMITKTPDGKLMWLETGNSKVGLNKIVSKHGDELINSGIISNVDEIPIVIDDLVYNKKPVSTGRNEMGPFADYMVDGKTYRLAYGDNGFIVSFYPKY